MKDQINNNNNATLIGVGSNIKPVENIQSALELLSGKVAISRIASIWQTPAVGSQGPDYLNTAILISNPPRQDELKNEVLLKVEETLGRVRTANKNADRTIDLDVLIYKGNCLDDDLWTQAHIAIPAAELLPAYVNLDTGENLSALSERLRESVKFILRSDLEFPF